MPKSEIHEITMKSAKVAVWLFTFNAAAVLVLVLLSVIPFEKILLAKAVKQQDQLKKIGNSILSHHLSEEKSIAYVKDCGLSIGQIGVNKELDPTYTRYPYTIVGGESRFIDVKLKPPNGYKVCGELIVVYDYKNEAISFNIVPLQIRWCQDI